ncbi:MAG: alpha/beta hydrolase [Treponema sp.]|nr:alpha/beta hydrolase [Treponema sp.]
MAKLNLINLFEDEENLDEKNLPNYTNLDFVSNGSHIYGEILWPAFCNQKKHPCVIMLHGFPGSARNDDISHALCRAGCVVIVPHHRGAWGSQGKYLVTNCVEDAFNLALYVKSPDFSKKYNVDKDNVFLLGHSIGGNSALNAGKKLDWLKGIIMLAPFDPTCFLSRGKEGYIDALLHEGNILNSDGLDSIYNDILENKEDLKFSNAAKFVCSKNILIFTAKYDSVSENEKMVSPLWNYLQKNKTDSIQRFVEYPTEHGLLGRRVSMIKEIGKFINEC